MQIVQASLLPFHLHRQTITVSEGMTIEQIVDVIIPHKIKGVDIVVNIGDHVIPRSNWKNVKPKPMTVIGINAVAAGGGGGGKKNPLMTILSIAIVVATVIYAPYLAPYVAQATGASLATATALTQIGLSMIGSLALSMLAGTPKQRSRVDNASPAEASSQFIEGASNKIDRYGVIPVNLGKNRMFPPQGALPYTETSAGKQYVRQIFCYGYGKLKVSDRKLGETSLLEYDGIETNERLNADLSEGVSLYSNDVFQDGYSVLLTNATGYVTRTTQPNTDEVDVDITFTQGLTSYSDSGQRNNRTVDFEVRYALSGTSNWSNANSNVTIASQNVTVDAPTAWNVNLNKRVAYGVLVINLDTGVVSSINYDENSSPVIPENSIRIASFRTESTSVSPPIVANIHNLVDERASHIPSKIVNAGDFALTYGGTGLTISIASGTLSSRRWSVTDATAQPLRLSRNIKFPSRAQYDIQIKRLTADNLDERTRDEATLTAIRSIRYSSPILQTNISGEAIRMLATDQLNGTVNTYNCVVSTLIKDYDHTTSQWIEDVESSNPASIYRYVLQSPAFVKALTDSRIDIEKLEEWHDFCRLNNLTFNKIIDRPTSIDELLNDIAAAGMATIHKINGVYSVIIDNERPTIKGMVTPRNSWGYSGTITYPDLPHALRVQFRNKDAGYNTDERIVYADGYNESNATLFERLQFESCTDANLAWFYGRRYLATAVLQPEIHNFNMDFENLTFNRGDKIVFVNDAVLVGVGSARIKELVFDDPDTPTEVLGFIADDVVNIPNTNQFGVRIRYNDASGFLYHSLTTVVGNTDEFTFSTPIPYADRPPIGSLCAFTEFGKELELVITEIRMNKDHTASITALNYAPERFDATNEPIPAFQSNITIPIDFYRPNAPELDGLIQSDESVMLKNSDGSYTSRMLIPLRNNNEPSVRPIVAARVLGATQWFKPDILSYDPELLVVTGLQDGSVYDFRISYQRATGQQLLSAPLSLNNVTYKGASARPGNVTGFRVSVSESIGLFEWLNNADIDISHYIIRFSSVLSGATWATSQVVADNITANRISLPIQSGTYLIKAMDILGNESEEATTIVSTDAGAFNNVVELLNQQPTWSGTRTNTQVFDSKLYLSDQTLIGYYYFDPEPFDLGEVYESTLSSSLVANGVFFNRVRDWGSTRDEDSARGADGTIIRDVTSIRGLTSVRGVDPTDWSIRLEMRKSDDDVTWTAWETFTVGKHIFRYVEFRLVIESFDPNINVQVTTAEVLIDMPDRYETGEDMPCPPTGLTVTYSAPFKNSPSVNITLQDGAVDDRLEYVSKTSSGFTVKVYNATAAGYVTRSLDYNAAGYGRVIV